MKNYILDTNVLLHDPNSILNFQEHNVLIPIEVIEEVDRFKRESTERGTNARTVSRTLDSLRAKGRLSEGVGLPNVGRLRIVFHDRNQNGHLTVGDNNVDSRIVALAITVQQAHPKQRTILITKDINLRIKSSKTKKHSANKQANEQEVINIFLHYNTCIKIQLMQSTLSDLHHRSVVTCLQTGR